MGVLIQIPLLFLPAWTIKWFEGCLWIIIFSFFAEGLAYYLLNHDAGLVKLTHYATYKTMGNIPVIRILLHNGISVADSWVGFSL